MPTSIWRLGEEGAEASPAVNGLTGRYATNADFSNRGLALLRRHFVCDRPPLTHRRNFFSDGIQSDEMERRFATGAHAIEHVDFQSRAFWQRLKKPDGIVCVTSCLSICGHNPL